MSVEKLVEAAKGEDWDFVDGCMEQVCNDPTYLFWARWDGLSDEDGNVRDLAVSIFEKTNSPEEFDVVKDKLRELMKSDSNQYVRFRSAFALYGHGDRDSDVSAVFREALNDKDVRHIAKTYLNDE